MKNILTVLKKELLRVFKDKRLIISLLLPGIMIYGLYTLMGNTMMNSNQEDLEATYNIYTINMPADVSSVLGLADLEIKAEYISMTTSELEAKKEQLKNGEIDLIIQFSNSFSSDIANGVKPEMFIYYNPSESRSSYAYGKISTGLGVYNQLVLDARGIDAAVFVQNIQPTFDEKTALASGFAMLVPFLIISFLFSGCMAVAPDAIAGEKERGTIATILITPIKRSQLALGKVFALGILASISALSSFIGLMFSLPNLMGDVNMGSIYGFPEYAMMLFVLIATVLLIIGAMSILSSFAKSVKEAGMLIMPFMFLSMLVGLGALLGNGAATSAIVYIIPLYNSVQAITAILTFAVTPLNLILTIISNFIYLAICVYCLTKLFNSERVMFSK